MLVLLQMTNQTTQTWQYTTEKIEKFQESRDGFESMTRRISQATLNTYWDYLDKNGQPRPKNVLSSAYDSFIPVGYGRMSELRFTSGPMLGSSLDQALVPSGGGKWPTHGIFFQAPLGLAEEQTTKQLNNLLNTWGYFIEVGDDSTDRPAFIGDTVTPLRWRARLKEYMQPTERMAMHELAYTSNNNSWFSAALQISPASTTPPRPVRNLSENVIALIIQPKLSKQEEQSRKDSVPAQQHVLAPNYLYTSRPDLLPGYSAGSALLSPGVTLKTTDPMEAAGLNPKNQLPPIVQVTMVAIDERSAARLAPSKTQPYPIGPDPAKYFKDKAENLEQPDTGDLALYEKDLVNAKVTYRIFTSNVSIRGAKWSRAQTQ